MKRSLSGAALACFSLCIALFPVAWVHGETAFGQLKARAVAPLAALRPAPPALGGHPLIVVHASREFDEQAAAAPGIDAVVARFKSEKRPVVYLMHDRTPGGYARWYTRDRRPEHEVFSEGGEHNLPLAGDEVTIVGGFFGSYDMHRGCQTLATRDAIRMHFEASARPLTVHLPVGAIYFYEEDALMREKLLAFDEKTASPADMTRLFEDFPRLYFLTENFSEVPAFGHPYGFVPDPENKAYRNGDSVDVVGYTFELFFNGVSVSKFGQGPRQVLLKLETERSR